MDVARYVPLMATFSLVVAWAVGAVPNPPNAVAAISIAAVSVPTERIRYSSTRIIRQVAMALFGTGCGVSSVDVTPLRATR
jgi:hypothetical protein